MLSFSWIVACLVTRAYAEPLPSSTERALEGHAPTAQGPLPTEPPQHPLHNLYARSYSPYSTTYGTADPEVCGYLSYDPGKRLRCSPDPIPD